MGRADCDGRGNTQIWTGRSRSGEKSRGRKRNNGTKRRKRSKGRRKRKKGI